MPDWSFTSAAVCDHDLIESPSDSCCLSPAACESPLAGSLCDRSQLFGSIGGVRDRLGVRGITIDGDTYQYYQGVASGGINETFLYSGRNDYFINVDGQKAGLWEGLFITLHGETRYGDTINGDTGAVLPVNTGGVFPVPTGTQTALSGVKFTQMFSENLLVFAGKINTLDEFLMPFTGARALDGFSNLGNLP